VALLALMKDTHCATIFEEGCVTSSAFLDWASELIPCKLFDAKHSMLPFFLSIFCYLSCE